MRASPKAGLLLAVAALSILTLFGVLALAAARESYFGWDLTWAHRIQALTLFPVPSLLRGVSFLGNRLPAWMLAGSVVLLLALRRSLQEAWILGGTALLSNTANSLLKLWIARPRPEVDLVAVREVNLSLSFPSGHAMFFVSFFGVLALLLSSQSRSKASRALLWGAAATLCLLVGLARVYLGAHWPSDVLGGYLGGGFFLVIAVAVVRANQRNSSNC